MKTFRIIAIATLLVLLFPAILIAQSTEKDILQGLSDSDIKIGQFSLMQQDQLLRASSEVYLKQQGDGNYADLTQSGENTHIYVLQYQFCGEGNYTNVNQDGSNLYAGVIQAGSGNTVDLDMIGDNMITGIGQFGYDNEVKLELTEEHNYFGILQFKFRQQGDRHSIVYSNEGYELGFGWNSDYVTVPISITQKGMGAKLIIR